MALEGEMWMTTSSIKLIPTNIKNSDAVLSLNMMKNSAVMQQALNLLGSKTTTICQIVRLITNMFAAKTNRKDIRSASAGRYLAIKAYTIMTTIPISIDSIRKTEGIYNKLQ